MTITIPSEDAVWVADDLYCKTPEALELALDTLRTFGYRVTNERKKGSSIKEGRTTPEEMEKHGWSLWSAALEGHTFGKCRSCNALISRRGIHMHGHTCENCGAVTYRAFAKGMPIIFRFVDDGRSWLAQNLRMTVQRWDAEEGWLYLKWKFGDAPYGILGPKEAKVYLEENADKWEFVQEGDERLVRLRYKLQHFGEPADELAVIDVRDTLHGVANYDDVKLWDGKEYPEYGFGENRFPVPEFISVYETWHWAPLELSPTLHKRLFGAVHQVSDAGYYYQDGSRAWDDHSIFRRMGVFVRHFTTLDADRWDRESTGFRLDGPGAIADVARFCHPDAVVDNQPNIGNFVVGVAKLAEGRPLIGNEAVALAAAVTEDLDTQDLIQQMTRKCPE